MRELWAGWVLQTRPWVRAVSLRPLERAVPRSLLYLGLFFSQPHLGPHGTREKEAKARMERKAVAFGEAPGAPGAGQREALALSQAGPSPKLVSS